MLRLLKLKVWITIVLLCYSTSLYANDSNYFPTGEVVEQVDSVLISYDDLRVVNSKLIELKYEKEINTNLKQVIINDSIIIKNYSNLNNRLNNDCKVAIRQRNICLGVGIIAIICSILSFMK